MQMRQPFAFVHLCDVVAKLSVFQWGYLSKNCRVYLHNEHIRAMNAPTTYPIKKCLVYFLRIMITPRTCLREVGHTRYDSRPMQHLKRQKGSQIQGILPRLSAGSDPACKRNWRHKVQSASNIAFDALEPKCFALLWCQIGCWCMPSVAGIRFGAAARQTATVLVLWAQCQMPHRITCLLHFRGGCGKKSLNILPHLINAPLSFATIFQEKKCDHYASKYGMF